MIHHVFCLSDYIGAQALQNSNLELTWDQEDAERMNTTKRRFTKDDLEDMNFSAYLASSGSESDDESNANPLRIREKYKALLDGNGQHNEEIGQEDMEITFTSGLTDQKSDSRKENRHNKLDKIETSRGDQFLKPKKTKTLQQRQNQEELETSKNEIRSMDTHKQFKSPDSYFVNSLNDSEDQSFKPINKRGLHKKESSRNSAVTEKKQDEKQYAELQLLMMSDFIRSPQTNSQTGSTDQHKKLKLTKNHSKSHEKQTEDDFEVNVSDPRFSALYESSDYAIDPSNSQ